MKRETLWSIEEYLRQQGIAYDDATLRAIEQHFEPLVVHLGDDLVAPQKDASITELTEKHEALEQKLYNEKHEVEALRAALLGIIDMATGAYDFSKPYMLETLHTIAGLCTGALQEYPK